VTTRVPLIARVLRDERGATMVEFAIIFPLLAILVFGAIDFGRAFFIRNSLISAAREGARVGAVFRDMCTTAGQATAVATMRTKAIGVLVRFGGAVPTAAQLTATITPATPQRTCEAGPTIVRVNIVDYPFTPLTPVMRLINRNGVFRINTSASYRWEWGAR
jgi:Flp pilus assembly protein TadG